MNYTKWSKMSLTEKIRWRNKHPVKNSWFFVDKILAKEIALQRAPECKVNKIIYIPEKPEDIDTSKLPKDYVFKANHGSGWLIKVKDGKNARTGEEITNKYLIESAKEWTNKIYSSGREKQYTLIKPKVFFEEYLDDFIEYRFFCFGGKVTFLMVDMHETNETRTTIYDTNWNRIKARWIDSEGKNISKPQNLSNVINIIEKLSTNIDFIRIDVFIKGRDIYFGEFTFTPNGGGGAIHPAKYDALWGSYWTHDMLSKYKLKVQKNLKNINLHTKIYLNAKIKFYLIINKLKRLLKKR